MLKYAVQQNLRSLLFDKYQAFFMKQLDSINSRNYKLKGNKGAYAFKFRGKTYCDNPTMDLHQIPRLDKSLQQEFLDLENTIHEIHEENKSIDAYLIRLFNQARVFDDLYLLMPEILHETLDTIRKRVKGLQESKVCPTQAKEFLALNEEYTKLVYNRTVANLYL